MADAWLSKLLQAMQWFAEAGAFVFIPIGRSPDYDLVADTGERLLRVQVKTSRVRRKGRWQVSLATRGGNQSWSGLVKVLDPARCDAVFIHVDDGRRWFIPSGELGGGTHIALGGPKYAQFEVEQGSPLPVRAPSYRAPRR